MGTGSVGGIGKCKLIYLSRITKVISILEYSNNPAYKVKISNSCRDKWSRRGDNIYFKDHQGNWKQRKNHFHGLSEMDHDLSGKNVLVCSEFWCFGDNALTIPEDFKCLVKSGSNCKSNVGKEEVAPFIEWVSGNPKGINGDPSSITHNNTP